MFETDVQLPFLTATTNRPWFSYVIYNDSGHDCHSDPVLDGNYQPTFVFAHKMLPSSVSPVVRLLFSTANRDQLLLSPVTDYQSNFVFSRDINFWLVFSIPNCHSPQDYQSSPCLSSITFMLYLDQGLGSVRFKIGFSSLNAFWSGVLEISSGKSREFLIGPLVPTLLPNFALMEPTL